MLALRSSLGRVWIVRRRARRIGLTPRRIGSCNSGPTSLLRIRHRRLLCLCQIRSPHLRTMGRRLVRSAHPYTVHCTFAAFRDDQATRLLSPLGECSVLDL